MPERTHLTPRPEREPFGGGAQVVERAPESRRAPLREGTAGKEHKLVQLIVFTLSDEEFGAEIGQVREIIKTGTITPIPDSPAFIKGVTNVRGEIVAAIDLRARFVLSGEHDAPSKHIVLTQQGQNLFGLMVDEVTEVLRVPDTEIKPAPEVITRMHEEYVNGVVTLNNRLIILLDLPKVLSEEELTRMSEAQRKQRDLEAAAARRRADAKRPAEATGGPAQAPSAVEKKKARRK